MSGPTPFHLAFTVRDLDSTRAFYGGVLGCEMGRSAPTWQDFDLFGHQLSAHVGPVSEAAGGAVDGDTVPVPHFGVVLPMSAWERVADRLKSRDIAFLIAPRIRFAGEPGEQGTFFVRDPSGNTLEFKGFMDGGQLFKG
ncbi:MAG: VOC family protein [Pseudomonadota bacterium]